MEGGGVKPPARTVSVTAIRPFHYPAIEDGKWVSRLYNEGEKLDMDANHVQRFINSNHVKRTPGRKKAVQVEENK